MAAMSATAGYENLIPYQEGLCAQWRPARLDYVARITRGLTLPLNEPLRICDLACGGGFSILVLAIANPRSDFVGIDFNPTHIADARANVAKYQIGNAQFYNRSVAEVEDLALGEFDIVTISGAYSWLAPEVRRAVRSFVRKYLKPGGYFGVHHMTQPGWSSVEPLWKIARDLAAPTESDSAKRHAATVATIKELLNIGFLKNHSIAARRFNELAKLTPDAFAHEYLTAHWQPEYHLDLARALAEDASLIYVGDTLNLWRNVGILAVPKGLDKILEASNDSTIRETLQDYAVMVLDRHSLYHKGQVPPGRTVGDIAGLQLGQMGQFGRKLESGVASANGTIKLEEPRYASVLSVVADRSRTPEEILAHPACKGIDRKTLSETIGILLAGEFLLPFAHASEVHEVSSVNSFTISAFNRDQLVHQIRHGIYALASPTLGHAIGVSETDARFIEGLVKVGRKGMESWLRQRFRGATVNRKGGEKLEGEAALRYLIEGFEVFWKEKVPKLCELNILVPE